MVGWIKNMDGWMEKNEKNRWMDGWIEKKNEKNRWMVGWKNI